MADFTAINWTQTEIMADGYGMAADDALPLDFSSVDGSFGPPLVTTYFFMRWKDVDCGPVTYRTWIVTDAPDPTGAQYVGPKCGGTAITGAVVAASWSV